MAKVERKAVGGKKENTIPEPVLMYMGGVDLTDQHHSYYTVGRPSVCWWRYLRWWLLQTLMVNAFLLWKASEPPTADKKMKHTDFRLEVLRTMTQGKSTVCHNSAPDIPSVSGITSARPLTHVVEHFSGTKRNCAVCEEAKKKTEKGYGVKTVYGCLVCRVHLCKDECFVTFYQCLAQAISQPQ